jgi:Fe-S-cluster containining protein
MLMGNVWMFDEEGCPGLTDTGCIMPYEERPLMCRLYPWIAVPILGTRQKDAYTDLLLYTTTCPQWKAFGDDYDIARKEFENG